MQQYVHHMCTSYLFIRHILSEVLVRLDVIINNLFRKVRRTLLFEVANCKVEHRFNDVPPALEILSAVLTNGMQPKRKKAGMMRTIAQPSFAAPSVLVV